MPNSFWTETGNSISLTPVAASIDPGSSTANVNYLTNAYKITFMQQYSAELAIKTALDEAATTWSCSSAYYDNAVANISTALIGFGAPANWATTWPDGTTSGPWSGVQTNLANLWAQVATQRTALQAAISAAQAGAAQTAAISAAAADATAKSNAVQLMSQPHQVAWAYASKPALPSSSYPAGYFAITSDYHLVQVSTDGSAWTDVFVATSVLAGQITTKQLVVMDYTNLCLNPSFEDGLNSWYADTTNPIAGSVTLISNFTHSGGSAIYLTSDGSTHEIDNGNVVTCSPGDTYTAAVWAYLNGTLSGGSATLYLIYSDKNGNTLGNNGGTALNLTSGSWVQTRTTGTMPAGCVHVKLGLVNYGLATGTVYLDDFDFRHCADAQVIIDGSIKAVKIDATDLHVNAANIDGTLTALQIDATNLEVAAANITGTLSAAKVLFPDGSALTTASRVTNTLAKSTGSITVNGSTLLALPGMSISTPVASGNDVFNISYMLEGNLSTYASVCNLNISVVVDGVTGSPKDSIGYQFAVSSSMYNAINIPGNLSLTGLSVGTHTIALYANSAGNFNVNGGSSRANFQRFY
jgi:hypothetical protein